MALSLAKRGAHVVAVARTTGGVHKVVKLFEYCKPTDELCRPRAAGQKPGA